MSQSRPGSVSPASSHRETIAPEKTTTTALSNPGYEIDKSDPPPKRPSIDFPEYKPDLSETKTAGASIHLQYTKHQEVNLKKFDDEIRGLRDIATFLQNSSIVLQDDSTNLRELVSRLIQNTLKDASAEQVDELASQVFAQGSTLKHTLKAYKKDEVGIHYQDSWLCTMVSAVGLEKPRVGISMLPEKLNLAETSEEVQFIIMVIAPADGKQTKSGVEISRSFSTLFSDADLRMNLLQTDSEAEFHKVLQNEYDKLSNTKPSMILTETAESSKSEAPQFRDALNIPLWHIGKGMWYDLTNRYPGYVSDWTDGLNNGRSVGKSLSAAVFIYFACLLPSIAFGNLNASHTDNWLTVERTLISQTIGGLVFGIFSTQPIVILLTTAPIAIYITIIRDLAEPLGTDLKTLYVLTGLWNVFFLILYSFFNMSKLMRYSTRSVEEVFGLFIACAFTKDAVKHITGAFDKYYHPYTNDTLTFGNVKDLNTYASRDMSLLWLLLALGTMWLGMFLFNFRKSPYLVNWLRETCSDYALAISVLVFSLIGSGGFSLIKFTPFFTRPEGEILAPPEMTGISATSILGSMGLGFCLSLLFFMDQNISAALTNAPQHNLKKVGGYHFDLFLVALINLVLTLLGLPWVHGALPHSPLHVRALADFKETTIEDGHVVEQITHVRECRTSHVLSHILIGLSILMIPVPLDLIPKPVLDGLFLFVAMTSLYGNQFFERILLLFTEQRAYPPNHYIRRVPQRVVHTFTALQFVQLLVLAIVGFYPFAYLKIIFPVLIMALLPVRQFLLPKVINQKYLDALDGHHD